jgi:hypothetical protein
VTKLSSGGAIMANIMIENIDELKHTVLPFERRFDSTGDLALDGKVSEMYQKKQYHLLPKTDEEAKARGLKNFNGLVSSAVELHPYIQDGQTIVAVTLAPSRYMIGQAFRDCVKEGMYTPDEIQKASPDMTGVSLIVPVKMNGQYFLLSQIKGKALGSGEIHTGLVAGNVDQKYHSAQNPFIATLQNECSEELGIDLSHIDSTSFIFLVDERETGQINFASVARNADINKILGAYEAMTKKKLQNNEALEVMALTNLPIAGLALIPLEDGALGVKGIKCYKPTNQGLVETIEDRKVRPYTAATVDYLGRSDKNVEFLLNKAGY